MTERKAELLLAGVVLARSTSYLFSKIGLRTLDIFNLMGLRFLAGFLLLALLFRGRLRHLGAKTVLRGAALGFSFFLVMAAELTGLKTAPSSTASLLVNTAVVLVPLLEAALRRRLPERRTVLGALAALSGVAVLTLRSSLSIHAGELLCIAAALLYAGSIILTDRLSRRDDPLTIGILQVGFVGVFALAASLLTETPRLPDSGVEWGVVLALAVVCTGFGFTLQPVAQRYIDVERAGLFCALNPVAAAVLGGLVLRERLGWRGVIGCALVLSAVTLFRAGGPAKGGSAGEGGPDQAGIKAKQGAL